VLTVLLLLSLAGIALVLVVAVAHQDTSYYNKLGQESRAASPAFFPSHA